MSSSLDRVYVRIVTGAIEKVMITTSRLQLRHWRHADRVAFAAMNADSEGMGDQGGPIDRATSDSKLDRYATAFRERGLGRWVIEKGEEFLGYAGVMPSWPGHPLGTHYEIGWRLVRTAWGRGYATEAARAALADSFTRARLTEVLAYTAPDNARSQAVMSRLGLQREPSRDFIATNEVVGSWKGLVWSAHPA